MNWPKIRKELMLLTKLGEDGKKKHILIGRHLQAELSKNQDFKSTYCLNIQTN